MSPKLDASQFTALSDTVQEGIAWNLDGYLNHFSPSSLSLLRECPRKFQQRYIRLLRERPGESPVVGNAVHRALERNFAQKIASHEDIPTVELVDWYSDEGFADTLFREQERAGLDVTWDTSPEEAMGRGRKMLGAYRNEVAPRIQPLSVEGSFSVDLGIPVPVVGRYDLERDESAVDFKSSKQKTSKPKESWQIQASIYSQATGKPVEFHTLACTLKTSAVSIVTPLESEALLVAQSPRSIAESRRTIAAIVREACFYMACFGPEEDWPTYGRFHMFACDYCGFRADCPAWGSE